MCPFTLLFYVLIAVLGLGGGTGSLTTLLNSLLGGAST